MGSHEHPPLQAFWPGLQVLVGDVEFAAQSHQRFFALWQQFGLLPERFLLSEQTIHPTERYYPLRPELAESTYALFQATRDPWYGPTPRRSPCVSMDSSLTPPLLN